MKAKHVLMSTVAVIGLAACSSQQDTGSGYSGSGGGLANSIYPGGAPSVVYQQTGGMFNSHDVALESRGRPMPIVVGANGGAAHPSLTTGVTQEAHGANWGAPLHFVPASGRELAQANADPDRGQIASPYSIVMMFDAPREVTGAQLCANPEIADMPAVASASSSSTTLLSSLCRYDKQISETTARVASVRGPDDPAIGDLVHASVKELTTPMSIEGSDSLENDD